MSKLPLTSPLLLFFLLPFNVISQPTTTQNDQTTLLNLKHYWSNPPSLNHWNHSSNPCTWPEITCTTTTVTGITIINQGITGTIPSFICELKNITHLDLNYNQFTGEFPTTLYNCTNLQHLDLSQNSFVGRIPDDISRLSPKLRYLNLCDNNFTGDIPVSISRLSKLTSLQLHKNLLNGSFPDEIGYLNNLEELNMGYNPFKPSRLPPVFTRLKKVRKFCMAEANLIGEIPRNLSSMIAIKLLDLSRNQFSGNLPKKLAPKLSILDVSNNRFTGRIPAGFFFWESLRVFKASYNLLDGALPEWLSELENLETLLLDGNHVTGELPKFISSWKSLNTLNLSRNQLTGQIPDALGFLDALKVVDLSRNNLSGQIPSNIGNWLVFLNLSSNNLTGIIPSQLNDEAFDKSFLNNPGLCSDNLSFGLKSCSSVSKTAQSSKISAKVMAMIASIVVVLLLLVALMTICVLGFYRRRKYGLDLKWKFIAFQKLNFTESTILPRLTENNVVGQGRFGKVYRVAVNRSGDFVAVKKISSKKDIDQSLDKEFLAEIEILSTIRHSNIVKLMGCISCDNSKLLVYEYLENRSLDRWLHLRQTPSIRGLNGSVRHVVLDWPKRLQIALGAARGLCYMHHDCSPGVVHRDVKSSNVLLDSEFNAKIADFGLARILAKENEANSMSTVAGSFGYMVP